MIIPEDKKRIATIMASRKTAQGENLGSAPMKPEIVKMEDGSMDGRHAAAQDMMAALHEKSPERLMRAMANFQDIHSTMVPNNSSEE